MWGKKKPTLSAAAGQSDEEPEIPEISADSVAEEDTRTDADSTEADPPIAGPLTRSRSGRAGDLPPSHADAASTPPEIRAPPSLAGAIPKRRSAPTRGTFFHNLQKFGHPKPMYRFSSKMAATPRRLFRNTITEAVTDVSRHHGINLYSIAHLDCTSNDSHSAALPPRAIGPCKGSRRGVAQRPPGNTAAPSPC